MQNRLKPHTLETWRQEFLREGPDVVLAYLKEYLTPEEGETEEEYKRYLKHALCEIAKAYDINLRQDEGDF